MRSGLGAVGAFDIAGRRRLWHLVVRPLSLTSARGRLKLFR